MASKTLRELRELQSGERKTLCADCRHAIVHLPVRGETLAIKSIRIRCQQKHWLDSRGNERIFKTLGPLYNEASVHLRKDCEDYQESMVSPDTWAEI